MADKPILFSGPMVRALLAGSKTQTRRVLKPKPSAFAGNPVPPEGRSWVAKSRDEPYFAMHDDQVHWCWWDEYNRQGPDWIKLRIAKGDRLYVREAWRCNGWATDVATVMYRASEDEGYTAMTEQYPVGGKKPMRVTGTWRPGIHMPRWASRLTLTVTDVRVERLQDCTEADALAEGMTQATAEAIMGPDELALYAATHIVCPEARGRILYETIWDHINGAGAWALNPWVAAYSFTVHRGNIDQMGAA